MESIIALVLFLMIFIPILEGMTLLLVKSVNDREERTVSKAKLKSIVALSIYVMLIAIICIILVGFLIVTF